MRPIQSRIGKKVAIIFGGHFKETFFWGENQIDEFCVDEARICFDKYGDITFDEAQKCDFVEVLQKKYVQFLIFTLPFTGEIEKVLLRHNGEILPERQAQIICEQANISEDLLRSFAKKNNLYRPSETSCFEIDATIYFLSKIRFLKMSRKGGVSNA